MDTNINFLRQEGLKVEKKEKVSHGFRWLVVGLTFFLVVAMVGLAIYNFALNLRSKRLTEELSVTQARINGVKDVELMNDILAKKTESFQTILNDQKHHHQIADYLFTVLPAGISVNGFSISKENKLIFSGMADSLKSLSQFMDNLRNKQGGEILINQIVMSGLSGAAEENTASPTKYDFAIELSFLQL
jgi:Tfp pilus assembly protein PilN